jgi:subtilisin family serine protease
MATPHVAGAFAALRSLHPAASVDRIEQALKSTGLDVGGRARIRVFDAANALGPAPPRETSAQP